MGAKIGQQGPPGAKKSPFTKMIFDHMECQNRCFWRVLSLWWPVFILVKSESALKMCSSKNDPRPFGVHKQMK